MLPESVQPLLSVVPPDFTRLVAPPSPSPIAAASEPSLFPSVSVSVRAPEPVKPRAPVLVKLAELPFAKFAFSVAPFVPMVKRRSVD